MPFTFNPNAPVFKPPKSKEEIIEDEIREDIELVKIDPFRFNPPTLKHPDDSRVILAAINQRPAVLLDIPHEYLKMDILKKILEENGTSLSFIPPSLKTKELCLIAVRQTDRAIEFVPAFIKNSPENKIFYEIAIEHDPQNLSIVPKKMLTEHLIRKALFMNPNIIYIGGLKERILTQIPDYQDEPIPLLLQRQLSKTHTYQGSDGVCGRHAFSRVIVKNFFELILPLVFTSDYTKNSCNSILNTQVLQSDPLTTLRELTPEKCSPGGYLKILLFLHLFCLFQHHIETIPDRPPGWLECVQVSALYKHLYTSITIPMISSNQRNNLMDALHTLHKIQTKYNISFATFHFKDVTTDNIKKITDHGLYLMLRIEDSTNPTKFHAAHFVIIVGAFDEYMLLKNSWGSDLIYKIKIDQPFYLGPYRYDKNTDCSFVIPVEQSNNEDFDNLARVDEYLEKYEHLKSKLNNVLVNVVQTCPSYDKTPEECENDQHYRQQALLFHPDKNPRCVESATLKFQHLKTLKGCNRDKVSTKKLALTAGKTRRRKKRMR